MRPKFDFAIFKRVKYVLLTKRVRDCTFIVVRKRG